MNPTDVRELYLVRKFPGLSGKLPWLPLGKFPTPVQRMDQLAARIGASALFVKRDDLSGEEYGGNKVRKLEFTLADAFKRKRNPVITLGAVGSNHVLATTIYAKKIGIETVGVFVPQPVQQYLRDNILANCCQGCQIEYVEGDLKAPLRIASIYLRDWIAKRRRPYLLWAGGSSTLGVMGYVEAGLEIAAQVREGMMPEPAFAFVPVGSAGTFSGLALGLKLAGLKTRAVGVRVYARALANEKIAAFMLNRALAYLRRLDPAIPNVKTRARELTMLHDYFGAAYAQFTKKGMEAIALASELEGLTLDGAYSGKAMAGFIEFMADPSRKNLPALFIATYNSIPLDPLIASCPGPSILPEPVRQYFHKDIAPIAD
ncbi:MAG TPA: pyridoxal-phosphate dependent enzyme [bacterium]|nr:pyridoxal-phosphate dependent enzyme [bacterium]